MNWIFNHYIEIIAAIMGVTGVWLTTKQNIWCWPIGLLNVTLSMFVFFQSKLYYDFVLQIFYFFTTLYGWYSWMYGIKKDEGNLKVSKISKKKLIFYILICVVLTMLLGNIAKEYTDASLPYYDAFTTVGGVIATLWMARKIIENWLAWIVIDFTCTFIYIYKELYAFSVLYFIFAILAIYGFVEWKKSLK